MWETCFVRCPSLVLWLLCVPAAAAAWVPNGSPVSIGPGYQSRPLLCPDFSGGWYISFSDGRFDASGDAGLQHLSPDGSVAAGWALNGMIVANGVYDQTIASLVPDGSGGVVLGWQDDSSNSGDLYLLRLGADGSIAPGWPATGAPIAVGPATQALLQLAGDGHGGAYATWDVEPTFSGNDTAYVQHVTASGSVSPGWPTGGRLLSPGIPESGVTALLEDGEGGVFVGWEVDAHAQCDTTALLVQHFQADGSIVAGWPVGGQVLTRDVGARHVSGLASDGAGGVYAVWDDNHACGGSVFAEDVYAQHVLANGTIALGWPAKGLPLCTVPNTQWNSTICSDGAGGFYAAWDDYRTGSGQVFVERVTAAGQPAPGWIAAGQPISTAPGYTLSARLTPDGLGGLYIAFEQIDSHYHAYCQHVTGAGVPAPGWSSSGALLVNIPGDSDQQDIVGTSDGTGGVVVAWDDTRSGDADIYAQRLEMDGPVPVEVSLVRAEAGVGRVDLEWYVSVSGPFAIERREANGAWQTLASVDPDGAGHVAWTDTGVEAAHRYDYRLAWTSAAGQQSSPEVWVDVPAGYRLELAGFTPNPALGAPRVTFTLPDLSPARLQAVDVTGRVVFDTDVTSFGPGRHTLALVRGLAPGLYWLRLNQGGRELRARAVVLK